MQGHSLDFYTFTIEKEAVVFSKFDGTDTEGDVYTIQQFFRNSFFTLINTEAGSVNVRIVDVPKINIFQPHWNSKLAFFTGVDTSGVEIFGDFCSGSIDDFHA